MIRYSSPLGFPLLDSFPKFLPSEPTSDRLSVHTLLSTSPDISRKLRDTQSFASVLDIIDREETFNYLSCLAEAYQSDSYDSESDEY
jgi:spermidine synthase